ncbi:MAG: diguanylate cyclase, partial [Thermodesulfovibrionales bacterium]|nr:diguanylate cyclase [Thermodesulfovibrionales bacterium]
VIGPVAARYFLLTGGRYKSIKTDLAEWTGTIREIEVLLKSFTELIPEMLFNRLIEGVTGLLKASAALIMVLENSSPKILAYTGLSKRFIENNLFLLRSIFKDIFEKAEWLRIRNVKENPELSDYFLKEDIRSFIAVPVNMAEGKAVLCVFDRRQRDFNERDNLILSILSSFSSLILSRGITSEEDVEKKIEELQRMNIELERLNNAKSRFLANMSHELRTPLNTILGFSEVLLERARGGLTPEQERYIRNIHNAGKYLLELVNNVLDLSKIESGKYDMVYETFSLRQMVDEVMKTIEPLASRKNIKVHLNFQEGIEDITADRIKLKQVFYNLLNNAIKFTPEAGRIGLVITRDKNRPGKYGGLPSDAEVIVCSVWDTGVGIKPEDQIRIFDEFEQADSSLSRQAGGAGLGLALTKRFVELHGGEISLESSPGKGSTFTFFIPASIPETKEPVLEVETAGIDYAASKEDAPLILLIEDDLATVELLTLHLSQAGYRVSHAFDGIEGIEKAKSLRPFAIILDIMIPKKDGWEVLQELKASEQTSSIPVIIHSIVDNRELAFTLGAADYLLKPLDKEALLSRLEELSLSMQRERVPKSVLIIESDASTVAELTELFLSGGFQIHEAREGKSGLELASAVRPAMILIGIDLPDISGFDMVRQLRENPVTKDIPLFLLTQKDIPVEERLELVGKIERIIKKHTFEPKDLISYIQELEMLYPRKAGLVDELTGLFNHRYLVLRLAQEVERAHRYKLPLNLLLLDIDFFGRYVRERGEFYGNIVLKKIAELLKKNTRGSDVVVRYGGDAFAIILANTSFEAARALGNRFSAIIKNHPFLYAETLPKGKITVSVGLATLETQSAEELLWCAEKALKEAIRHGGDRVEVYNSSAMMV